MRQKHWEMSLWAGMSWWEFWFYEYFQTDLSKCYEELASRNLQNTTSALGTWTEQKVPTTAHWDVKHALEISIKNFYFLWEIFILDWLSMRIFNSMTVHIAIHSKTLFLIRLKRIFFAVHNAQCSMHMKLQLILDNNFQHIFWDSWF